MQTLDELWILFREEMMNMQMGKWLGDETGVQKKKNKMMIQIERF